MIAVAHVLQERQSDARENALLDPDHRRRRGDRKIELARAFAAYVEQARHVDHPDRDREYNGRQNGARRYLVYTQRPSRLQ